MVLSHKSRVVIQFLVPLALAYACAGWLIFKGNVPSAAVLSSYVGGTAGLAVVMALIQDVVPKSFKEAIVFWRLSHRLPGHRAFSMKFIDESRFDWERITNWAELSVLSPGAQQRTFYKVYKKRESEVRIKHYSFRYLAWRDVASSSALLAITTVPALGLWESQTTLLSAITLASGVLVCSVAAGLAAQFTARVRTH